MMVEITVDDRVLAVQEGQSLLEACLANGIFIPNLCHLPGMAEPPASCRLCFVAVDGRPQPVTACTVAVEAGLVVRTDTPTVRRLQRSALRLLLSVHEVDCKDCPANKRCALQQLARFLGVGLKPRDLPAHRKTPAVDDAHPCFSFFPNRCVLCGRCVEACRGATGQTVMAFSRRGFETVLHFDARAADAERCQACRACVAICPVGALVMKSG